MAKKDKAVMKKVLDLKHSKNTKRSAKLINAISKSIENYGFVTPLVIDKQGTVLVGNARFAAAKKMGLVKVPCIITNIKPGIVKELMALDKSVDELVI